MECGRAQSDDFFYLNIITSCLNSPYTLKQNSIYLY